MKNVKNKNRVEFFNIENNELKKVDSLEELGEVEVQAQPEQEVQAQVQEQDQAPTSQEVQPEQAPSQEQDQPEQDQVPSQAQAEQELKIQENKQVQKFLNKLNEVKNSLNEIKITYEIKNINLKLDLDKMDIDFINYRLNKRVEFIDNEIKSIVLKFNQDIKNRFIIFEEYKELATSINRALKDLFLSIDYFNQKSGAFKQNADCIKLANNFRAVIASIKSTAKDFELEKMQVIEGEVVEQEQD